MLRIIFYILPFMTCLFWFVTFALRSRSNDSAKRVLTVFLGTCTVLYLCHAFFFLTEELPVWADSIWGLCSLSVYPLYFIYITHLTCRPLTKGQTAMCLLPGLLVALAMLICPGEEVGTVRKLVNAVQIICVIYFGYRRLHAFDKEVANIYADTEGRDTSAVKILLIAFTAISILSVVVNMAGRQYFASSEANRQGNWDRLYASNHEANKIGNPNLIPGQLTASQYAGGAMYFIQAKRNDALTMQLNSILNMDQSMYGNGTLCNMKFHPTALQGEGGWQKLRAVMESYFDGGGMELQLNIVSSDTLRDAQKHPENYKDLVVRVAGFSAYFVEVFKESQDDLIRRTELGL